MNKPLVAIFAHPDDEAFGPAGSLAHFTKEREVYLICITQGDAGKNSSKKTEELGEIRRRELAASAKILGIKKVHFLGYHDGGLNNNLYHEVADQIEKILCHYQPDTLLTFHLTGISGHLDHIFASLVTSYLFNKLEFIKQLLYYGEQEEMLSLMRSDYFIYMPPGFKGGESNFEIDIADTWDTKMTAFKAHVSQKHDAEWVTSFLEKFPKIEYFLKIDK